MRTLRSVGQGALVVDFALYLHALGWSGVAIGLVLSAGGLFGAALSLLVGVSSDRLRRRPFLIGYEIVSLLATGVVLITARPAALATAAIVAGFGRGANGAAGPFSPAEQAWLAEAVAPLRRGWVYSLNAALGFFGMGAGALLAILPSLWQPWLAGALAYRPLFALVGAASIGNLALLAGAQKRYRRPLPLTDPEQRRHDRRIRRRENSILGRQDGDKRVQRRSSRPDSAAPLLLVRHALPSRTRSDCSGHGGRVPDHRRVDAVRWPIDADDRAHPLDRLVARHRRDPSPPAAVDAHLWVRHPWCTCCARRSIALRSARGRRWRSAWCATSAADWRPASTPSRCRSFSRSDASLAGSSPRPLGFFTSPFVAGAFLQAAYVFLDARTLRNYDAGGKKSVLPQRTRGAEKEGFSTNTEEEAETPL